ncbi:DUF4932 domain-containing protein [Spirosoma aerophilum]
MNYSLVRFLSWLLFSSGIAIAQPITRQVTVQVNPTVETIATLMNQLSTEFLPDSAKDPAGYRRSRSMRINYNAFRSYTNHPAIRATKALADKLGTGVYLLGLYARPLPATGWQHPVSPLLLAAVNTNPDSAATIVNEYMAQVARFYQDAHLGQFLAQQRSTYQKAIGQVSRNRPSVDFIPTMEAYYGSRKQAYTIVVMPFFITQWGMGWQTGEEQQARLFNISAPYGDQHVLGQRVVDPGFNDREAVRTLCVHEFGHSFVNPYTMQPEWTERINQYKDLFKPVPNQAQYTDWLTLFNELTVRAGEIRIALKMGLPRESQRLRGLYKDWPYLDHFSAQLASYEKNRARYPAFTDFLPDLIGSLEKLRSR